jgi:hypothetical protein
MIAVKAQSVHISQAAVQAYRISESKPEYPLLSFRALPLSKF